MFSVMGGMDVVLNFLSSLLMLFEYLVFLNLAFLNYLLDLFINSYILLIQHQVKDHMQGKIFGQGI